MAASILLVFEKPDTTNHNNEQRWRGLTLNLEDLAKSNKEIEILGDNCLMLPIDRGLDIFHQVLDPHRSLGVSYKYLILPEGIEWHIVKK